MAAIICPGNAKIFVLCPGGYATGGPEALHQLAHHLIKLGFTASMYYYCTPAGSQPTHSYYVNYQVPVSIELENDPKNLMIVPESYLLPIFDKKFRKIRKVIWWLSVDYYFIELDNYIKGLKNKKFYTLRNAFGMFNIATLKCLTRMKIIHIGHSWYSMVFLRENGIKPVGQIGDYVNETFFNQPAPVVKEDIIIYNPKKNDAFLSGIICQTPDLVWKAIEGMKPSEVAGCMAHAKLYIDFGFHPGKERMPREAALMNCCLIIGKSGSAAYLEDMPIPPEYRFDKISDNMRDIITRINDCLLNYDKRVSEFKSYRDGVFSEQDKFVQDIKNIFSLNLIAESETP